MSKGVAVLKVLAGGIVGILIVLIGVSFVNHRIQLSKEDESLLPIGKMVEVNGHDIHVYVEGDGSETLVFLSGGGTCSPVLDFKSLYSLLSEEYQIAVVEKAGYGFSEVSAVDRDMDTILSETRQALSEAGLQAPYILFPHSMSGLEALYWAQQYPEEVLGIVGLDMAVPEAYEDYSINRFVVNLGTFGSRIGITRFFPDVVESSAAIQTGTLTAEEKDLYRAIFYRKTLTKSMILEVDALQSNADKVKESGMPDAPMLLFVSNGEGTGWDNQAWISYQTEYSRKSDLITHVKLDCGHYVHDIEYERIAEESDQYIKALVKGSKGQKGAASSSIRVD